MSDNIVKHSQAWVNFTYLNFLVSSCMMAIGIFWIPIDLASKGFFLMATLMIMQSAITVTKTMRDNDEASKMYNKIEDAKTEKLLMEVNQPDAA